MWMEVILPLAIPKTYTYSVPGSLLNKLQMVAGQKLFLEKIKSMRAS